MQYKVSGPTIVDGHANVNITPHPDNTCQIDYTFTARIGTLISKKVFGRRFEQFIGHTANYSGAVNVPNEMISEAWLKQNSQASFGKVKMVKVADDKWELSAGPVGGSVHLAFDGIDPVVIHALDLNVAGVSARLELVG